MPLLLLLLGCTTAERTSLVDHALWEESASDPLASHAADHAPCLPEGWGPELGGLEVDTGKCPYANLIQPTLTGIRSGDTLAVDWWHQTLASVEPAEGHIALLIEDDVVWERFLEIPGAASAYGESVILDVATPAGAPLTLHLHNHGTNTWNINRVEIVPP